MSIPVRSINTLHRRTVPHAGFAAGQDDNVSGDVLLRSGKLYHEVREELP